MAKTRSHSSRRLRTKLSPPPAPALLKTRSTWSLACSASSSSRNRSTCASSATSQTWPVTRTPDGASACARATVSAMVSGFRSQAATAQPCAASWRVSSRPMPDPPPVTTASFAVNESIAMMLTAGAPAGQRSRGAIELDQAGAEGQAGEVGAPAAAGLVPNPVQVRADRAHGDVQLGRDLSVGAALRDQDDQL